MKYEAPLFEAINLQVNDVITTSQPDTPYQPTSIDDVSFDINPLNPAP